MEHMGSLGGSSITDMLPDKLLIQPSGNTYTRSGQKVQVGLHVYICPACGKRFEATTQHRYRTERKQQGDQKVRVYCSYKCFRPVEKQIQEAFKADCLGFVPANGRDKPALELAMIRVEKCKRKMEEYRAVIIDPVRMNAMTAMQRASKKNSYREWKNKLEQALEALEVLKEHERTIGQL